MQVSGTLRPGPSEPTEPCPDDGLAADGPDDGQQSRNVQPGDEHPQLAGGSLGQLSGTAAGASGSQDGGTHGDSGGASASQQGHPSTSAPPRSCSASRRDHTFEAVQPSAEDCAGRDGTGAGPSGLSGSQRGGTHTRRDPSWTHAGGGPRSFRVGRGLSKGEAGEEEGGDGVGHAASHRGEAQHGTDRQLQQRPSEQQEAAAARDADVEDAFMDAMDTGEVYSMGSPSPGASPRHSPAPGADALGGEADAMDLGVLGGDGEEAVGGAGVGAGAAVGTGHAGVFAEPDEGRVRELLAEEEGDGPEKEEEEVEPLSGSSAMEDEEEDEGDLTEGEEVLLRVEEPAAAGGALAGDAGQGMRGLAAQADDGYVDDMVLQIVDDLLRAHVDGEVAQADPHRPGAGGGRAGEAAGAGGPADADAAARQRRLEAAEAAAAAGRFLAFARLWVAAALAANVRPTALPEYRALALRAMRQQQLALQDLLVVRALLAEGRPALPEQRRVDVEAGAERRRGEAGPVVDGPDPQVVAGAAATASALLFSYGSGYGNSSPYDEPDVDPWSSDDDDEQDTTAEQFYDPHNPKDIQGIPWDRLQFTRSHYRDTRLRQYRNYTNLLPDDDGGAYRTELAPMCVAPRRGGMGPHHPPHNAQPAQQQQQAAAAAQQQQPAAVGGDRGGGGGDRDVDGGARRQREEDGAGDGHAPMVEGEDGDGPREAEVQWRRRQQQQGQDNPQQQQQERAADPGSRQGLAARPGANGAGCGPAGGPGPCFFSFVHNSRCVQSNIVHFQLRNLVWATSRNDVFVVHDNCVNHWSPASRAVTRVLDLSGSSKAGRVPGLGRVQVSTLCVLGDLVAAGGFMGELVVKRLSGPLQQHHQHQHHQHTPQPHAQRGAAPYDNGARHVELLLPHYVRQQHPHLAGAGGAAAPRGHPPHRAGMHQPAAAAATAAGNAAGRSWGAGQRPSSTAAAGGCRGGTAHGSLLYCGRITNSDNGITNGLEIFDSPAHGTVVMASNNDAALRLFAAPHGEGSLRLLARWPYDWAVNYATMRPGAGVAAVVGDDPCTLLTDVHNGTTVASLAGHRDYSFAAAWHPGGHLLATGNQDTTALVWDIRRTAQPLVRLAGRMGAIRSLRFSPDGRFLALSEPADFVHVYDVAAGFTACQELDFFGEIAGLTFTPDASTLFVGVSDLTYASLMHFERQRCAW